MNNQQVHSLRYIFWCIAYGSCWIQLPLILLNPVLFISPYLVANDKLFIKYFLWQYNVNFHFILLVFGAVRLSPFAYLVDVKCGFDLHPFDCQRLCKFYMFDHAYMFSWAICLICMASPHYKCCVSSSIRILVSSRPPDLSFPRVLGLSSDGSWCEQLMTEERWNDGLGGSRGKHASGLHVSVNSTCFPWPDVPGNVS